MGRSCERAVRSPGTRTTYVLKERERERERERHRVSISDARRNAVFSQVVSPENGGSGQEGSSIEKFILGRDIERKGIIAKSVTAGFASAR